MLWGIHARAKFLAMTKPTHKALSTRTCMCLCVCVCRAECLCTHLCEYVNIYAITNGSVNTIATHINNPNIFWQMLELVLFGFWTLELDYNAWLMIADKKNHFNLLRGFFSPPLLCVALQPRFRSRWMISFSLNFSTIQLKSCRNCNTYTTFVAHK